MATFSIILTAGGTGKRMGSALPKQFLLIQNKPVLLHTLEAFYRFNPDFQLIITLPESWATYWEELLRKFNCTIPHLLVDGGKERYHSIKNALVHCHGDFVFIHDGVRPFVSTETLQRCSDLVIQSGQVVPVLPIKESIRELTSNGTRTAERSAFRLVQTPQCFSREVLIKAYEQPYHTGITDDASLVEEAGFPIFLTEGNEENIKITTPFDLLIAEAILQNKGSKTKEN